MRGAKFTMLSLLLAGVSLLPAIASEEQPSRCAAMETPIASGKPHIFIPPGFVPRTGPLEAADLARGQNRKSVVTCIELLPSLAGVDLGVQGRPLWAVHVEAPFSKLVRGAHGSCSASHMMVFLADDGGSLVSTVGIGQKCNMQPYRLTRGR